MYRGYKAQNEKMAAGNKLKVVMFLGTVRDGRLGPRVAKFVQGQLQTKYNITLFGERLGKLCVHNDYAFFTRVPHCV